MALKKFFGILCLLAFIILPTNRLEAVPTVAVLPFDNKSARQTTESLEDIFDGVREIVEIDIVGTNRFQQVPRTPEDIQKALDSIKFDHSGLVDPATAAQYGKMLGAQYLVLGTVTGISTKGNETIAHLSLRMIEVERAVITLAGRGTGKAKGKSKDDIQEALRKAADDALNGKRGMLTMMRGGKK